MIIPHKQHILKRSGIWFIAWLGLSAMMLLLPSCKTLTPASSTPGIELEDCQLSLPGSSLRLDAQCGQLLVYEDQITRTGRQIVLNIAVIPAVSRSPEPDPLFFLAGGPGEAATQSYLAVAAAFSGIRARRDIVLVDQRGTGGSHPLTCNASDQPEKDDISYIRNCLDQLDADTRFYTTSVAMQDLDQVRAALGYEKINLYGASYGTRAALVYLRMYPDRVRTTILDGAAPPNWTLGPTVAGDAQRALEMFFERCASEIGCQNAFPNLKTEFDTLVEKLQQQAVEVELDNPINGEPTTITLDYAGFALTLQSMSYMPETAALIPLAIHNAYSRNDFRSIASQTLSASQQLSASISSGMRFSVICAEDVPFYDTQPVSAGYMQELFTQTILPICEQWPRGDIPADFKAPVKSDVPVLIISGSADPVTPPYNGDLAAQTLSDSLHLVISQMGHINIFRGCVPRIAQDFIESGTTVGLDVACAAGIAPMPFFINFSGPTP